MSARLRNALLRVGCQSREDVLLVAARCSRQAFLSCQNVGARSLRELEEWAGVPLRNGRDEPWKDRLHCDEVIAEERAQERRVRLALKADASRVKKTRCSKKMRLRLSDRLRGRLSRAIRGTRKLGSAVHDLGCTVAELKAHLERQFLPGMTWENYGLGKESWTIDHIFPLSRARLTDREQFLRVCHYTNLQPLWWADNMRKGASIPRRGAKKQAPLPAR